MLYKAQNRITAIKALSIQELATATLRFQQAASLCKREKAECFSVLKKKEKLKYFNLKGLNEKVSHFKSKITELFVVNSV